MIYLFVLFLLLCLSFRYDINGKTKYRDECYFTMLVVFILIAGLRWRVGVDTHRYLYSFYHEYPTLENFNLKEYYIGKDPLYTLINVIVKSLGGRFYIVQLIQATFVNVLIMHYFKKHSKYVFTCALFYFLLSYIAFMMEIMRASFGIAISLYAFDYFLEKKWVKGYFLLFIALMFHAQTLVLFFFPALLHFHFNKKGIIMLVGAYIFGVFAQDLLADYVFLFEDNDKLERKFAGYTSEDSSYGKNDHNVFYYLVSLFPYIIYSLYSLWYTKKKCSNEGLKKLEPIIMLGVAFVLIQTTFLIAYRYVDYFRIYFALFYAETCVEMVVRKKYLMRNVAFLTVIVLFSPVMLSLIYFTAIKDPRYIYSSVLNKTINKEKENRFARLSMNNGRYFSPRYNEY